jgi:predicted solute-binding protein
VNQYSIDLGDAGKRAIETLFAKARAVGVIPPVAHPLFLS